MDTWRTAWASNKRDIALHLARRECGGSYGEAVIILCAAISAMAADAWPGRAKDRVRFVQLLKEFAPASSVVTRISIPLLVGSLRQQDRDTERSALEEAFLPFDRSRVLTGDDVDRSEGDILAVCTSLQLSELRACSYATLLYEEVRSGYGHEYGPGSRADSLSMSGTRTAPVSYVNLVPEPDRRIHFHVEWIASVALGVAAAVDAASKTLSREDPVQWWLNG